MSVAIYTATSGAVAQQMRLEILANNLSNINTVGFKGDRATFRASYVQELEKDDTKKTSASKEVQMPSSSLPFGSFTDFSSGQVKHTGNLLDLALEGNGFFCVKTPNGIKYTRAGNLTINKEDTLVTQQGFPVLGDGGAIKIDGHGIIVDGEGNISVDGGQIDTLKIVDFPRPYRLDKAGDTLFVPLDPGAKGNKAEGVEVRQGFVEISNVSAVSMMMEMIEALRGYESYQKVIRSVDEVTSKAINEVGRVA